MPNHRINKRITYSDKFYSISWKAQLTYLLGFAFLDDFGVWTASPRELWKELFVYHKQIKEKDIPDILEELAEVNLIKLYAIEGKLYQQYENFNTFQSFGQGYNKKKSYPEFEECDVDPEHHERDTSNWVYSGVKGCMRVFLSVGSPSHSLSNSNSPSNTNTNTKPKLYLYYREDEIDKLQLEEKGVLKCFYAIGYKLREDYIDSWNKWILEIKKDNSEKNLLSNAKKWRDYFEDKPPKNHKSSFRNWVEKEYADKKESKVVSMKLTPNQQEAAEYLRKQIKEQKFGK